MCQVGLYTSHTPENDGFMTQIHDGTYEWRCTLYDGRRFDVCLECIICKWFDWIGSTHEKDRRAMNFPFLTSVSAKKSDMGCTGINGRFIIPKHICATWLYMCQVCPLICLSCVNKSQRRGTKVSLLMFSLRENPAACLPDAYSKYTSKFSDDDHEIHKTALSLCAWLKRKRQRAREALAPKVARFAEDQKTIRQSVVARASSQLRRADWHSVAVRAYTYACTQIHVHASPNRIHKLSETHISRASSFSGGYTRLVICVG